MANYCNNCGAKLKANAKFCTICGTKVFSENNSAPVTLEKKSPATSGESLQERYLRLKAQATEKKSAPITVKEIMADAKKISQPTPPQPAAQNSSSYTPPPAPSTNYNPQPAPQQNYNPLGAVPPHVPDENFHDLFLKREGRLNRWRFFKRQLLASLITITPAQILAEMVTENSYNLYSAMRMSVFLTMVGCLAYTYLTYGLLIRRSHDFPRGSFFADMVDKDDTKLAKIAILLNFIGGVSGALTGYFAVTGSRSSVEGFSLIFLATIVVGGFIGLYFLFKGGEIGPNKYGADPLGNFR